RTLPLEAFLVAAQLNALHRHHQGHLVEIARILNGMTAEQRASLCISDWDPSEAYDRVERLFVSLCKVLEERPVVDSVEVDAGWFANRIRAAAIPGKFRTSSSIAVDGPTWRPGVRCTETAPPWNWTGRPPRRNPWRRHRRSAGQSR